jgi:ABC-2 type transport system ATP-binding protein
MIDVRSLTRTFRDQRAVDDLSFTAPAGSVTGFLGPNGAGKTTTLRCLLGLAMPTAGVALIDGCSYRDLATPRQHVGAVLEASGFHPARTARNHLRVIAHAAGLPASCIEPLLELVGLTGAAHRRVGGYSLGMRQRLGLATALLGDPSVIILDEPTNALDPEGVAWIRQLLRRWARQGKTVLVSSHLLAEIAQVADRVVIITRGQLVTEIDLPAVTKERVRVRVDDTTAMRAVLVRADLDHEQLDDGTLAIDGADPATIGVLAQRAGVTVTELGRQSPSETLEAIFLAATGARQ